MEKEIIESKVTNVITDRKMMYFNPDQNKINQIHEEYLEICKDEDRSKIEVDQNPMNMDKNRYPDVLVIKETAVKLGPINGVEGSEYINANFVIDKSNPDIKKQKYICCQAPLSSTFNDFWRMIWEYKVPVIVMITNLVEKNRIKADPYWPTEPKSVLCYGGIFVKLIREKTVGNKNVTIRIFNLWKPQVSPPTNINTQSESKSPRGSGSDDELPPPSTSTGSEDPPSGDDDEDSSDSEIEPADGLETRQVVQLHCTKWPDFGVPKSTGVMKDLIAEVDIRKKGVHRPIVVHCSAGIGRTGTFVAIHMSLQKALVGELIDIKETVRSLRSQRLGMVQSKEQYLFVYYVVTDILRWRDEMSKFNKSGVQFNDDQNDASSPRPPELSARAKRRIISRRLTVQNQESPHVSTTRVHHSSFSNQSSALQVEGKSTDPPRRRNLVRAKNSPQSKAETTTTTNQLPVPVPQEKHLTHSSYGVFHGSHT